MNATSDETGWRPVDGSADTPVIHSVLVANRGEIARRVFRTCRGLGLSTVAVYSDPDAASAHVREADCAVRLPGSTSAQTYLRADAVVAAALAAGADAVHPGYGFLSENAAFARAVTAAGLTWIGPPPAALEAMGSKIEAKKLMAAAGVPVLDNLVPDTVTAAVLPVLIKASAGGGGRGMRVVRDVTELSSAVADAAAEAEAAFGDGTVFCEPYLASGHHIEVQVLADQHGQVWAVGERECSIQRRHQKVIEEAPSPLVERIEGMRGRLFDAAVAATRAIAYVGAGTVEFLADDDGRFFFLEMNTRLQVEHPVTECTTGLDLVAWQLALAQGARLGQHPPLVRGHSIEARLYAEDPSHGWLPQSGTLHRLTVPAATAEFCLPGPAGIRLDSGVTDGDLIGVHYDPMLAKVISVAPDRTSAARLLADALTRAEIHGLQTNRELLVRVLRHPAFGAGQTDTAFLDRHGVDVLSAPLLDDAAERLAALAAALADCAEARRTAAVGAGLPAGWRNVRSQPAIRRYRSRRAEHEVRYAVVRGELQSDDHPDIRLLMVEPTAVVLEKAGVATRFRIARYPRLVSVGSAAGSVDLQPVPRFSDPSAATEAGSLLAPMPGTIVRIAVEVGETVQAGQPMLYLEAMTMQYTVAAPSDGTVTALPVAAGEQVAVDQVLATVTESPQSQEES